MDFFRKNILKRPQTDKTEITGGNYDSGLDWIMENRGILKDAIRQAIRKRQFDKLPITGKLAGYTLPRTKGLISDIYNWMLEEENSRPGQKEILDFCIELRDLLTGGPAPIELVRFLDEIIDEGANFPRIALRPSQKKNRL